MGILSDKKKVLIKEISYFLSFLLFALIILELFIPGLVIFYLNINFLIIICLIFSIVDLLFDS